MLADPMGWRVPAGFFWLRASPLADASGVRRWWTSEAVFVAGFSTSSPAPSGQGVPAGAPPSS